MHTPAIITVHKQDLPDSQESVISTVSSTCSAPKLPSSASNLSTSTTTETESTTPSTTNVAATQSKPTETPMPKSPDQARAPDARANAPRVDTAAANAPQTGDTTAGPMPLQSPINQGFKRTADGSLKGEESVEHSTAERKFAHAHKRNKSMDTHRIGEVRDLVLGYILQGANTYAALRPTQDTSILRHGQSAERLGEAIA
jgi:hypothetical protein